MAESLGNKNNVYDLCIVGAGVVGSAIAAYASKKPGVKVCIIGPEEPSIRVSKTGREIFAAHYDSGRIASAGSVYPVWSTLAVRAMEKYCDIERESGITFFHNVGVIATGKRVFEARYSETRRSMLGRPVSNWELRRHHQYMSFAVDDHCMYYEDSGWIDPRKAILAQLCIAMNNGCDVIRDVVDHVIKDTKLNGDILMRVLTSRGTEIVARQVVLATNVFTTSRDLLPQNIKPKFHASPQTVVLAEVDEEDLPKLRNMPCYLYAGKGGASWYADYPRNPGGTINFYMLPPVLYPDEVCGVERVKEPNMFRMGRLWDEQSRVYLNGEKRMGRTVSE